MDPPKHTYFDFNDMERREKFMYFVLLIENYGLRACLTNYKRVNELIRHKY